MTCAQLTHNGIQGISIMPLNGSDEATPTNDRDDHDVALTRRKFLKRGAAVGVGAVALYVAPSMSSTRAKKAYASITGPPCTDTEPPQITSVFTLAEAEILHIDTAVGGYLTATATDNEALAEIEIELEFLGVPGDAYFTCADKVKSDSYTQYFDPFELAPGFYNGTATATDCCGNEGSQGFVLHVTDSSTAGG